VYFIGHYTVRHSKITVMYMFICSLYWCKTW